MTAREWLDDINRRLDAGENVHPNEYATAIEAYAAAARERIGNGRE